MTETLLNEKEAAMMLRLKPITLKMWRHYGKGPTFIKLSPRCVRYKKEDLDAWIESKASNTPEGK